MQHEGYEFMFSKYIRKQKTELPGSAKVKIDKNMRDYSKEAFFVKKIENAKALLDKYGVPDNLLFKR